MRSRRAVLWAAVTLSTAAAGAGVTRLPAQGHSCLQVDLLVPTTTTLVGTCAPHDPLTHDCGETPVGVVRIVQCTDVPVGLPVSPRAPR